LSAAGFLSGIRYIAMSFRPFSGSETDGMHQSDAFAQEVELKGIRVAVSASSPWRRNFYSVKVEI